MRRDRTVVLIDDDPVGRELTACVLLQASPGATIVECPTGKAGLRAVLDGQPDLVVTDNSMTDTSGLELIRAIRAAGKQVPIIMLTASHELEQAAVSLGVSTFLRSSDFGQLRTLAAGILSSD